MHPTPSSFLAPSKILVPMDFSASSYAAVEMATHLAQHFHAEISLLNVVPMLPSATVGTEFLPETSFIQEQSDYAAQRLDACAASLLAKGVKATAIVEIGNDVVGNIMMVVDREHVDMLVLSTHGMSGWRPVIFGSIAEKVVKLAQCPLMLLRCLPPALTSDVVQAA